MSSSSASSQEAVTARLGVYSPEAANSDLDPRLSELREVTLWFKEALPSSTYWVRVCDLEKFIEACKELHYRPGINPHNGRKAACLKEITVKRFKMFGPYWWSTPGLQNNYDKRGACIAMDSEKQIVFEAEAEQER